ncbi:glucoamylase family protein [Neolewinella antarctica]|uniref:Beta-glucosidase n=1 Tax=Neolewinella antarctica TaxID=442734 RepID=A0ABX0X7W1_9BACT|nr:glucoamylase family protein [Neolewinella antarctica]NJC25069.1 hypothetical protein [Neolewinella antarctica]
MHRIFTLIALSVCTLIAGQLRGQAGPVTGLVATAYDHHVELNWDAPTNPAVTSVRVFSAEGEGAFATVATYNTASRTHVSFLGDWNVTGRYFVRSITATGQLGAPSDTVSATTFEMTDSMLLDMVQEYTLRYFYDFGHPVSGLARERNTTSTVTSGGSGFGVMALIVGAERGFLTYEQALTRTNKMVDYLLEVPRFKGAFSHWMNGANRQVIPFSARDDGGDLVETAFLIQGLLTARQYYTGDSENEVRLRTNITQLWEEVNWNWYRKTTGNVIYWHWSPTNEFAINLPIRGFNESQIVYLLAVASPTAAFDVPASVYKSGWAGENYATNNSFYDIPLIVGRRKGGPLFFSHYSYLGFDPRGIRDDFANYFERNRNHSLINYEHCVDNPYNREGYGPNVWGLTASDDPDGYKAHSPDNQNDDNGTISPTAALSSMPYTPEESMRALKHFYREMGDRTWGPYGFYDAFNEGRDWYANSYLAIDQGPIICMIENARSGLLWDLFMKNPEIAPALAAVGFVKDATTATAELPAIFTEAPQLYPNPATDRLTVDLHLRAATDVTVDLYDLAGTRVQSLYKGEAGGAGAVPISLHLRPRPSAGYYFLKINTPGGSTLLPLVLQR